MISGNSNASRDVVACGAVLPTLGKCLLGPRCCGDAFDEDVAWRKGSVRKEWSRGDEAVWQCKVASAHLSDWKTRIRWLEVLEAERRLLDGGQSSLQSLQRQSVSFSAFGR